MRRIVVVFIFALLWGWGYLYLNHDNRGMRRYEHAAYAEEAEIAKHIARRDGFLSPFDPSPTAPPTAWSPPVYPHVLAAAFSRFGTNTIPSAQLLATINVICFAIVAACLVAISPRGGIVALVLLLIHPAMMYYVGDYWDSYLALAIFFIALAMAYHGCRTIGRAIFLGLFLGALLLTNTSYVLAVPVIVWAAANSRPKLLPRISRAATIAITLAMFVIVLVPWTVRNYLAFHQLMFIRSGAGVELWVGNHHGSTGWIPPVNPVHPYHSPEERSLVLQMGEPAYFHLAMQRFAHEFHPKKFIAMSILRAANLLLGDFEKNLLINSIVTILGVIGAIILTLRKEKDLWILAAGILSVVPFVFTSASDRYALPLRAVLMLMAGMGLTSRNAKPQAANRARSDSGKESR